MPRNSTRDLEKHGEAITALGVASKSFELLADKDRLANAITNLGTALSHAGRFEEALAAYDKADSLVIGGSEGATVLLVNRGSVLRNMGRFDQALLCLDRACTHTESILQAHVQSLGEASSSAYRQKLRPVLNVALMSCTAIVGPRDAQQAVAYKVFGTFMGLGMAAVIAERGRLPTLTLPEEEKRRHEELMRDIGREVSQRDSLRREMGASSSDNMRERDIELKTITEKVQTLLHEHSVLIERARQRQQVYVGIHYPKAATVDEVQSEIDDGVALVEYAVEGGDVFAFATTKTAQRLVALGKSTIVVEDVERVRAAIVARREPDPEQLRRLGERLLDPLLSGLPDESKVRTLLIAAHGDLARIPFEPLLVPDPAANAKPGATTNLLSRYDIAYVHSGTVMRAKRLDARHRTKPEGPAFVGFGFPVDAEAEGQADRPETGLMLAERAGRKPLPHSAREVLEIARHFANDEKEVETIEQALKAHAADKAGNSLRSVHGKRFHLLLRADATEKALKEDARVRTARILHLGCHGEADLISPALSRLVLARSGRIEKETGEDGYVYMRELRDLGISAELLVLSACETNAGKLRPLEGITGLSRAGLAAGAEAVISTFWRVDDDAAQELMREFYKRWLAGGVTRIEALSAAKRWAIEIGIPLKTWSAFALWDAKTK